VFRKYPLLIAALLSWGLMPPLNLTAAEIKVEEAQWGFDGRAVQGKFNMLSVLVSNPTNEPFDGGIKLTRSFYGADRVGAPLVQPLFVSPFSKKWIQFHPHLESNNFQWRLAWGTDPRHRFWGRVDEERHELDAPQFDKPATVILIDAGGALRRQSSLGLKDLKENLFPSSVTATDGLQAVVLDHNPRWQQPRRQALLDWLHAGGEIHLLKETDGSYPQFPSPLEVLNTPLPQHHVGAGTVIRHEFSRDGLTKEYVAERILREDVTEEQNTENANNYPYSLNLDTRLLTTLTSMTRPEHNWAVIYLMSIVYVLLIFPGGYLLGHRRVDYRLIIVALLGTIALFSVAFSIIGARGYGESTTVNAVAVARPLAEDQYDVSGWSNVFVTSGGDYVITHAGSGRYYSTCQSNEGVPGQIMETPGQRFFAVDIPPFSARSFAHRAKVNGPPLSYEVKEFTADDDGLQALSMSIETPIELKYQACVALYNNEFYRLSDRGGLLVAEKQGRRLHRFLDLSDNYSGPLRTNPRFSKEIDIEAAFQRTYAPLIAQNLGIIQNEQIADFQLPTDRARLYLVADMPVEFQLVSKGLTQQSGQTLFVIDVFKQP